TSILATTRFPDRPGDVPIVRVTWSSSVPFLQALGLANNGPLSRGKPPDGLAKPWSLWPELWKLTHSPGKTSQPGCGSSVIERSQADFSTKTDERCDSTSLEYGIGLAIVQGAPGVKGRCKGERMEAL